jgi:Tfp pilus assembly protein PilN
MDPLLKISSAIKYRRIGIIVVCKKIPAYDISYYQMLKKGNSVDICFSQEGLSSFDQIDVESKKYPSILCIQGSGLVQRMMKGSYADIRQNIPNINIDEYLIALDESNQSEKLVALCRKEQIESILGEAALQRIPVHGVSLGFLEISKYLQLFSGEDSTFNFEGNALHFKDNEILEFRKNVKEKAEDYFFAGKPRKASEILALAAGLTYLTDRIWNTFQMPLLKEKIKEYTAERLASFIFYYLGTVMFVLLLLNFLLFDHYNTKLDQLGIQSSGVALINNEINQLQSDLSVKKQFIQQNNVPKDFAFAFYADRLASYVPEGIEFSDLSVCPVINKVKENKVIGFQSNTLRVTGTAPSSTTFSIFLEKLNKSSWVSKLEKQVFNYNNDNDNADFELEILLNNATD